MGIEVGINSWGRFAQARLRSGQGRTSAVSGFTIIISHAWERNLVVCFISIYPRPVSCLLRPRSEMVLGVKVTVG